MPSDGDASIPMRLMQEGRRGPRLRFVAWGVTALWVGRLIGLAAQEALERAWALRVSGG